jgi:hypothetical protein
LPSPVAGPLLKSAAWLVAITAVSWALTVYRYRARA